jgi:peptidoglycan/LPS O-acetylase OafA/YrhL
MTRLEYYKPLDGVRGMAALMVMWFHFYWTGDSALLNFIENTAVFGQTGVALFFVLSGFLITRILLSNKQNGHHYFLNFYIRRSLRIFPLYFLFLFVFYFVIPLVFHYPPVPFGQQAYYWTYLQDFAKTFGWGAKGPDHFWSLSVEEHFYLFWPFIIYFMGLKNIKRTILFLIVLSIFLRIVLIHAGYPVFYWTFTNMDSLSMGALMAVFESENALTGKTNSVYLKIVAYGVIPILIPLWIFYGGEGIPTIQVVKPLLIVSIYYLLIVSVIRPQRNKLLKRFFSNGFLILTGRISYGLYVFHPLVFWMLSTTFLSDHLLLNFAASFIISYGVALTSFYLYEKPLLTLKKKFE